jgi:ribosomal protein L7/L12
MNRCPFCDTRVLGGVTTCPSCGAAVGDPTSDAHAFDSTASHLEQRVRSLLADGQKLEAIKLYRAETGLGLAEAKDAVEAIEAGRTPTKPPPDAPNEIEREALRLLENGKTIEAVKHYRDATGVSLKDAYKYVQSLGRYHKIQVKNPGCFGVWLLGMVSLAGAIGWAWV